MKRTIRGLVKSDAEKLLEYFRKLVRVDPERVETANDAESMTVESMEWLISRNNMRTIHKNRFAVCMENDEGKIIALAEVERRLRLIEQHVGDIRLGIFPEYEEYSVELMNLLCDYAGSMGMKSLISCQFETQEMGIKIMSKAGFVEVGNIPGYYHRGDEFIGQVILGKKL